MKRYYSMRIPEPCHEDWNLMTPTDKGRFCSSCDKTVIDFTKMNDLEIKDFLMINDGNKICGHVKKSQLERIHIKIPVQVLYNSSRGHHSFLLALLIIMGTTLMSCKNENGSKQKIDEVEVVDSLYDDVIMMGLIIPPPERDVDSLIQQVPLTGGIKVPPPPPEIIDIPLITGEIDTVEGGISWDFPEEH